MEVEIINADAKEVTAKADLIFTDPPYELSGVELAEILKNYSAHHLVMLTTMRQFIEFLPYTEKKLAFDFVLDFVIPKKSKSYSQPNYTHCNGVYLHDPQVLSVFNRKLRQRSDTFDNVGYWPTIIRASRERLQQHGKAKSITAVADILGSFDVKSVIDPFAGSGTTGFAAYEIDLPHVILIEKDVSHCKKIKNTLNFLGITYGEREK